MELPPADPRGWIRLPTGAYLFPSHSLPGFWHVKRADGSVMTRGGPLHKRSFPTIADALAALKAETANAA